MSTNLRNREGPLVNCMISFPAEGSPGCEGKTHKQVTPFSAKGLQKLIYPLTLLSFDHMIFTLLPCLCIGSN